MIYTIEVGLASTIYIPIFVKTSSGIKNLIGETHTDRQEGDLIFSK
jgi:hypothetical protein